MIRPWHAVLAAFAAFGVLGQLFVALDEGRSVVNLFSYFTIQSNILMFVTATLVAIRPDRDGRIFQALRLAGLTGITVTGLVYAIVLAKSADFSGIEWWLDKILHYVVPIMSVVGFVAFKPRTRMGPQVWWFIAWPLVWLAYTLVRAEVFTPSFTIGVDTAGENLTGPVPYDFLDAGQHGVVAVAIACVIVTALLVGLAWVYVTLSRRDAETALASP